MEPLPPDPRTTKGITHEQRYHLCLKKQDCPAMKQSELAAWFLETYSFPISQPTISHSLKKSAEILARGISAPGLEPTRVRRRPVRHPELEQALFQWVQQQHQEHGPEQSGEGSDSISGPALVRQAKRIAQEMDIHDTVFCPGWLSRFKMRVDIATAHPLSNSNKNNINSNSSRSQSLSRQYKQSAPSRSPITPATAPTDIDRFPGGICGIFIFIVFGGNINIGDNSGDAPRIPSVYTHYYTNQRNWISPSCAFLPVAFTALASHSRIPTSIAQ
ncbi:hypothetical protein KI688_002454 [Linnemannia hyalina]|uniref:HTH CENPB-type domain-containing protein n=1 Tax=Linnemannia hyalina TaxID=64524 RepID=A0A9P7XQA7_9FUNG|nr:hypothetical protein KI688_002454 [Linnemannia hyalina]